MAFVANEENSHRVKSGQRSFEDSVDIEEGLRVVEYLRAAKLF